MKMGTIASPWRYDAARNRTLATAEHTPKTPDILRGYRPILLGK
jgi:hypothetical protein